MSCEAAKNNFFEQENPHEKTPFVLLLGPDRQLFVGIAVPKGDPQLVNWLQNFLNSIEKAGYIKGLGEKWFAKPTWIDQIEIRKEA